LTQPLWGGDNIKKSDSFDIKEKQEYLEMYQNLNIIEESKV
jgi:hypothetical protein